MMMRYSIAAICLVWTVGAQAAVAIDATGTDSVSGAAVVTFDYTGLTVGAGLSNGALLVAIIASGTTGSNTAPSALAVNWDSAGTNQAMTQIGTNAISGSGTAYVSLWGLIAPTSGAKNLHITWTTSGQVIVCGISVSGANQTGGVTTFANFGKTSGTASNGALTVTSANNDMVVAAWEQGGTPSFSSTNNTQIFVDNGGSVMDAGENRAAGAATVSMTATWSATAGSNWGVAGVDIVAAAAGAACPQTLLPMGVGC